MNNPNTSCIQKGFIKSIEAGHLSIEEIELLNARGIFTMPKSSELPIDKCRVKRLVTKYFFNSNTLNLPGSSKTFSNFRQYQQFCMFSARWHFHCCG